LRNAVGHVWRRSARDSYCACAKGMEGFVGRAYLISRFIGASLLGKCCGWCSHDFTRCPNKRRTSAITLWQKMAGATHGLTHENIEAIDYIVAKVLLLHHRFIKGRIKIAELRIIKCDSAHHMVQ